MLKNRSLKLRYFVSFLLVLVPVVLFLTVLYTTSADNNKRSISGAVLEKFTYASENIANIIDRMDYAAASAAGLESSLEIDRIVSVRSEDQVTEALDKLESHFLPAVQALLYVWGDDVIYTSQGKMHYSQFEHSLADQYNLNMSQFFIHLQQGADRSLHTVQSPYGRPAAITYTLPFPAERPSSNARLIFFLNDAVISDEFQNYLGDFSCDLYIYDAFYHQLYRHQDQEQELLPFQQLIRRRGVGVQQGDDGLVITSFVNSQRGLSCAMVAREDVFFAEIHAVRRHFFIMISLLIITLLLLFIWLTFFNYQPINRLVSDITGKKSRRSYENEVELIRASYDRTVEEVEALSSHISEITPLVTQQFVIRLIQGKIETRKEFDTLARYAGLQFSHRWFCVFYILSPDAENDAPLEELSQAMLHFRPARLVMLQGEMPNENALCVAVNFDSGEQEIQQTAEAAAADILAVLDQDIPAHRVRIGIGGIYDDPLRMDESFSEASAAAQSSIGRAQRICRYTAFVDHPASQALSEPSPMARSLLADAVRRGEAAAASRALGRWIDSLDRATDSMLAFHFYAGNLVTQLVHLAQDEHIEVSQDQLHPLIYFNTKQEFQSAAQEFVAALCSAISVRNAQAESETHDRLMAYILAHYTDFNLSIQSVSDAVGVRKSMITAMIREELGLNFVQYISYLRMNEFKRLLLETDDTISACVTAIGYGDAPNFLRKFKLAEGMTAGQYRAAHRATQS